MSIRVKITCLVFLLGSLVVLALFWQNQSRLRAESEMMEAESRRLILDQIEILGRLALTSGQFDQVQTFIEQIQQRQNISSVVLADQSRTVRAAVPASMIGKPAWTFVSNNPAAWLSEKLSDGAKEIGLVAVEFSNEMAPGPGERAWQFGLMMAAAGIAAMAAVAWVAGFFATQRLANLAATADSAAEGHADITFDARGDDEVGRIATAFNEMMASAKEKLATANENEQRFRGVFEQAAAGIARVSLGGKFIEVNAAFAKLLGYDGESLAGKTLGDLTHVDDQESGVHAMRLVIAGVVPSMSLEQRFQSKEGQVIASIMTLSLVKDADATAKYLIAIIEDISDLKRAEESLRAAEQSYRQIYENATEGLYRTTLEGALLSANPALVRMNGFSTEEELIAAVNGRLSDYYVDSQRRHEFVKRIEQKGRVENFVSEFRKIKTGERVWISENAHAVRAKDGSLECIEGSVLDFTDRRRAEEALRERDAQSKAAARIAKLGHWVTDEVNGLLVDCSDELSRMLGVSKGEILGPKDKFRKFLHADDLERVVADYDSWARKPQKFELEYRIKREDGQVRHLREIGEPVFDTDGNLIQFCGTTQDVTDRHQTEQQLAQAQKMEAVGQLTGGIAHDFNNLLTIILGNLNFLKEDLENGELENAKENIEDALSAGRQGADLINRLLAFGRAQKLKPTAIDVNKLVGNCCRLLNRTIEETIKIQAVVSEDLWHAAVDPVQLEQSLINLAINSRDAMKDGGTLKLETKNKTISSNGPERPGSIEPGDYVEISVSDTGHGIPPENLEEVWQPFFTTKDVGKGSGLGLSMVYGFAKQSGGDVSIDSRLGVGTTVRLLLPKAEAADAEVKEPAPAEGESLNGFEKILIVEDDPGLRRVAKAMLGSLGYQVLEADDANAALALMAEDPDIDLLFTDVVLPMGMNGIALAEQVRTLYPAMKILYTSGYARAAAVHGDLPGEGARLVPKPYRKSSLAREVRQTLDATH